MQVKKLEAHYESSPASEEQPSSIRRAIMTLRPTSRGKIIGRAPEIHHVLDTIDRVARSSCTVLVTGESGTGKELVVAALHDASARREGPLVTINCGAIPLELVESELFGHARGAFTGAQGARRGLVAAAEGGTLFLDEVGELPLQVQVKLLRVLQQKEFTPLGESKSIKCDVRIVAATNRDLAEEVRAGRFREDLYYRLNVIHVHLPPLRERSGDVGLLARHFFRMSAEISGRTDLKGLSAAALAAVESNSWPGNVRALQNAIERGVLLARGPYVEVDDIFGARLPRAAVEHTSLRPTDPRLEPEEPSAPVSRDTLREPAPESLRIRDTIKEPAASNLRDTLREAPPPPQATILPLQRMPSNPAFPRVLPEAGLELFAVVEAYQNHLIRQALARTGGNKNRAAQLLGVNRTTLVEMIRRRGL